MTSLEQAHPQQEIHPICTKRFSPQGRSIKIRSLQLNVRLKPDLQGNGKKLENGGDGWSRKMSSVKISRGLLLMDLHRLKVLWHCGSELTLFPSSRTISDPHPRRAIWKKGSCPGRPRPEVLLPLLWRWDAVVHHPQGGAETGQGQGLRPLKVASHTESLLTPTGEQKPQLATLPKTEGSSSPANL